MLSTSLAAFNQKLGEFQQRFPVERWTSDFKDSLVNDFSFFSTRIEDDKLQYGDTIRFLKDETVPKSNLTSLLNVSEHQRVLKDLLEHLDNFSLTENTIKGIHKTLMNYPLAWDMDFKPELVGEYRNIAVVGNRQPMFENKEYVPFYNLPIAMSGHVELWNNRFEHIDNSTDEKHLLVQLTYFHNTFLNSLHPFADGNGRVCRIIMGAVMMKYGCPPIFSRILTEEDQVQYISAIVQCETSNSDEPLVTYFADGMAAYLQSRLKK